MFTPGVAIGLKIWLFSLAVIAVVLKFCVRWWLKTSYTWTDAFLILSMVLYLVEEIIAILLYKEGFFDRPAAQFSVGGYPELLKGTEDKERLSEMLRLLFFSTFVTFTIFWTIKGAFCALYYTLIPRWLKKLRWAVHITSAVCVISYIGYLGTNVFSCGAVGRNWSTNPNDFCFSFNGLTAVIYLTTMHLFTDLMVFVIPFFLLPHVMLPTPEKWGLVLMFALGLLTISCIVARTATVLTADSFTYHNLLTWDSGEITLGILVCCAPSIKWLILWATGYKRRQAIRAFNGQEGSTALSTVASRAGGSQASRAGQSPGGMGYDDNDGESKGESMDSFAVVVKHEVSVDVEGGSTRSLSGRAESRDGLNIGGDREHRGVWTETAKPERSFLHL